VGAESADSLTGEDERGGGADEAEEGGELVAVERGRHRVVVLEGHGETALRARKARAARAACRGVAVDYIKRPGSKTRDERRVE
jgi:hypothetical protein